MVSPSASLSCPRELVAPLALHSPAPEFPVSCSRLDTSRESRPMGLCPLLQVQHSDRTLKCDHEVELKSQHSVSRWAPGGRIMPPSPSCCISSSLAGPTLPRGQARAEQCWDSDQLHRWVATLVINVRAVWSRLLNCLLLQFHHP